MSCYWKIISFVVVTALHHPAIDPVTTTALAVIFIPYVSTVISSNEL